MKLKLDVSLLQVQSFHASGVQPEDLRDSGNCTSKDWACAMDSPYGWGNPCKRHGTVQAHQSSGIGCASDHCTLGTERCDTAFMSGPEQTCRECI